MAKLIACGLLMCRWHNQRLQYFLVHPGGPFFKNKEAGVWSIPKGIPEDREDLLATAEREFKEETGLTSSPPYYPLKPIQQKGGKVVHAWAFVGEWEESQGIVSNTFEIEWPPRSGKRQAFPEQERAAWLDFEQASIAINPAQISLLEEANDIFSAKT